MSFHEEGDHGSNYAPPPFATVRLEDIQSNPQPQAFQECAASYPVSFNEHSTTNLQTFAHPNSLVAYPRSVTSPHTEAPVIESTLSTNFDRSELHAGVLQAPQLRMTTVPHLNRSVSYPTLPSGLPNPSGESLGAAFHPWSLSSPAQSTLPQRDISPPHCYCGKRDNYSMKRCDSDNHEGPRPWLHIACIEEDPPLSAAETWLCLRCRTVPAKKRSTKVKEESPDDSEARSGQRPSSNKIRRQTILTTPTPQRRQRIATLSIGPSTKSIGIGHGSTWSSQEENLCIQVVKEVTDSGKCVRRDHIWDHASAELKLQGINRSPAGIKNAWNRSLRAKSGFDERAVPKPHMMRTGLLSTPSKKRKADESIAQDDDTEDADEEM